MGHLQVKNWDKFQHYKRRNPPWIRLYCDLEDDEDFMELTDAEKWWLVCCWRAASRDKTRTGLISSNEKSFKRKYDINSKTSVFDPLVERGFLVRKRDDSEVPADCEQLAIPETETETETETESEKISCTEPKNDSAPAERVLTLFDVVKKEPSHGWTHGEKLWPFTEAHMIELHGTWGDRINLVDCVKRAQQWCRDNSVKRKTYDGMRKFLGGWIANDVDKGKGLPPISLEATLGPKGSEG